MLSATGLRKPAVPLTFLIPIIRNMVCGTGIQQAMAEVLPLCCRD